MQLDLAALADGVVRNNVGVDAIELRVRGRIEGGHAVLAETGQRLPVAEAPGANAGPWLRFRVEGWQEAGGVVLHFLAGGDDPAAWDAPAGS